MKKTTGKGSPNLSSFPLLALLIDSIINGNTNDNSMFKESLHKANLYKTKTEARYTNYELILIYLRVLFILTLNNSWHLSF